MLYIFGEKRSINEEKFCAFKDSNIHIFSKCFDKTKYTTQKHMYSQK